MRSEPAPAPARRPGAAGLTRRRILLIAIPVVLVIAIVAATVCVLSPRRAQANLLSDLGSRPTVESWSTPGFRLPAGIQALGRVDQHRSLFFTPGADGAAEGRLLLLDSQNRSIVWSVGAASPVQEGSPLQLVATDPIVVNTVDGVVALAPTSGKVLSRTTGAVTVVGGDSTGALPDLDGDVIVQRGSTLERLASDALTTPKWSTTTKATGFVLAGSTVASGSTAFSAMTGKAVQWAGRAADEDVVVGGRLLARRTSFGNASATFALLDDSSGRTIKTFKSDDGDFVGFNSQVYVVKQGATARAYDLATGAQRWTAPAGTTTNPSIVVLPRSTGVIPLLTLSSATEVQIVDAASGEALYRLRTASATTPGAQVQVVGAGRRTLYLQDGATLRATGLRDGRPLWALKVHDGDAVLAVGEQLVVVGGAQSTIESLTE